MKITVAFAVSVLFFACERSVSISSELKRGIDSVIICEFKIIHPEIADKLLITVDSAHEPLYHVTVRVNASGQDSLRKFYWSYHINKQFEVINSQKNSLN